MLRVWGTLHHANRVRFVERRKGCIPVRSQLQRTADMSVDFEWGEAPAMRTALLVLCVTCLSAFAPLARALPNGSVVAWGSNAWGQCDGPGFITVAVGGQHCLGLRSDGAIMAWGSNSSGQCNVSAPNAGFVAVSAGSDHSLGLRSDGTIAAWGSNVWNQCSVPLPNDGFSAVAGASFTVWRPSRTERLSRGGRISRVSASSRSRTPISSRRPRACTTVWVSDVMA